MVGSFLDTRYRLLSPLGKGGFATTYLAEDAHRNNQPCVVKHLTPVQRSPQFLATARRLFASEVSVLKRLGTHECIPELIDAFEVAGEFYLVQSFIEGAALSDLFQSPGEFTEAHMIELLEATLPLLAFIHQQQVIHRDIKPSNLIRRHVDGKVVLIDFGAVKEIATGLNPELGEPATVSIGTQGYAPAEQMAGRPRYSSDLYALGMTVICGLTGRSPLELPENSETGEVVWQDSIANLSPGMQVFLKRLTHPSVYQRYSSAQAALQDLQHLETLTAASPCVETAIPKTTLLSRLPLPRCLGAGIATMGVATLVFLIRQLGGWMPLELLIYDQWVQWRATIASEGPDDRLLLVEITEADLQALDRSTPSDATLNQAIQTLQAANPRVIGLDLFRELPQAEKGEHDALLQSLESPNVIAIYSFGSGSGDAIPPPRTVSADQVGFNDVALDPDKVVRRNLMLAAVDDTPDAAMQPSFSYLLALRYLEQEGILPQSAVRPPHLDLNGAVFPRLLRHFGAYRGIEDAGYQVMLRYRSPQDVVQRLSLGDLLQGRFAADMIRDRAVIIGMTASSSKDLFDTPFSRGSLEQTPGVMLHVQATSQILSHALEGHPLLWTFPEAIEIGWLITAAAAGGVLAWKIRRPQWLGTCIAGGGIVVLTVPVIAFVASGWLPVFPASVSFFGSAIASTLWHSPQRDSRSLQHQNTTERN